MNKDTLKLISINRDAVSVNRGFYYQYLHVLQKWVENYIADKDEIVQTEVGDDIKQVGDKLIFTQVKSYTSTFSFKSPEIQKTLFNFYSLYLLEREQNPELGFAFQTNTAVSPKEVLLKKWVESQADLSGQLLNECAGRTKGILTAELKTIRGRHLSGSRLNAERKLFIKNAFIEINSDLTEETLNDFVKRVRWEFTAKPPDVAVELLYVKIEALLRHERFGDKPAELLMEVLLTEIYRHSQLKDERQRMVNGALMDSILARKSEELDQYSDRKFLGLLDQRFGTIYHALNEMQQDILGLKNQITHNSDHIVPHLISAVPFVRTDGVYQREQDSINLHHQLTEAKHLVISGSGGMGKSTLAKYYVHLNQDKYDHVLWLNGEPGILKSVLFQDDIQVNLDITVTKPDNEDKLLRGVLRKLGGLGGTNLLVIDDFRDVRYLDDIRALGNWKVLLTTRTRLADVDQFVLTSLILENAIKLYRKYEPDKPALPSDYTDFFEAVAYNPLLIEISAKTIHNSLDHDLAKFTALLKNQSLDDKELEIAIDVNQDGHTNLLQILTKTFDISGLDRDESYHLRFLSVLPSDIKISDLVTWYGTASAAENKVAFANIFNRLHQKGWLERSGDNVYLHKMLQEAVLYTMRREKAFIGLMFQLGWLSRRISEGISGNYNQALQFLRYGESVLTKIRAQDRESIFQPLLVVENEVLNVYTWIIGETKITERLEDLLRRAIDYLGEDVAFVGVIRNNLGMSYSEKGQFPAAEKELQTAIEILKKHHVGSETQLMYAICNLAMLYIETGDYKSFESRFDEAMAFRKEHKWYSDPSFPFQCGMLGFAQQSVGNYKESIRLYGIAIKAHQLLPAESKNDLNLILYLNNLSYSCFLDNQQDRALAFISQAVFQLERLTVKNDNKLFVILLNTLIEIVEKMGTADELNELLAAVEKIRNGPASK
jgi:tetratricopeptide (TPR) repeat protein